MEIIIKLIFLVTFIFVFRYLKNRLIKKNSIEENGSHFIVKLPEILIKSYVAIAIFLGGFTLLFFILYMDDRADFELCVFGFVLFIIVLLLLLVFKRWKVIVHGEMIEIVPMVGKKRSFSVDEITINGMKKNERLLLNARNKKIVSVEPMCENCTMLYNYIIEKKTMIKLSPEIH